MVEQKRGSGKGEVTGVMSERDGVLAEQSSGASGGDRGSGEGEGMQGEERGQGGRGGGEEGRTRGRAGPRVTEKTLHEADVTVDYNYDDDEERGAGMAGSKKERGTHVGPDPLRGVGDGEKEVERGVGGRDTRDGEEGEGETLKEWVVAPSIGLMADDEREEGKGLHETEERRGKRRGRESVVMSSPEVVRVFKRRRGDGEKACAPEGGNGGNPTGAKARASGGGGSQHLETGGDDPATLPAGSVHAKSDTTGKDKRGDMAPVSGLAAVLSRGESNPNVDPVSEGNGEGASVKSPNKQGGQGGKVYKQAVLQWGSGGKLNVTHSGNASASPMRGKETSSLRRKR